MKFTLWKFLWAGTAWLLVLTMYTSVNFIISKYRKDFVWVSIWNEIHKFSKSSIACGAETTTSTTTSRSNFNYSVTEIFPRKVYYDNRTVLATGRNLVCILAEVTDYVLRNNSIVACEMNGLTTKEVTVFVDSIAGWIRMKKKGVKYFFAFIMCAGLPCNAIGNHTIPNVIYKSRNGSLIPVPSEHPLIIFPEPELSDSFSKPNGGKSVVICTTMYGHPPRFNEWLKYQKTINVDRVHLNVERSFANNATQVYPFLGEALESGFVTMEIWEYPIKTVFYYSQSVKIQDCVMRHRGIFDFAFVQDCDDLFIPMVPNQVDIHYYLERLFINRNIGCVTIRWICYYCKPDPDLLANVKDGNITKSIDLNSFGMKIMGKTISRLEAVDVVSIHSARLMPNYKKMNINDTALAYMAHIRPRYKRCNTSTIQVGL